MLVGGVIWAGLEGEDATGIPAHLRPADGPHAPGYLPPYAFGL